MIGRAYCIVYNNPIMHIQGTVDEEVDPKEKNHEDGVL